MTLIENRMQSKTHETALPDDLQDTPLPLSEANPAGSLHYDREKEFLYIDHRTLFNTMLRIGSWQRGLTVSRWNEFSGCWEDDGDWDIGFTLQNLKYIADDLKDSFLEFLDPIPREVVSAVEPFEWRQFILLKMIRHNIKTIELIESNPVLAWLLADTLTKREIPVQSGSEMVLKKRRDIMEFCGGPKSDAAVAVMKRINANKFTQRMFEDLQTIVRDESKISRLKKVTNLNGRTLYHLSRDFDFACWINTCSDYHVAWADITSRDPESIYYSLWVDAKQVGTFLGIDRHVEKMSACKTLGAFRKLSVRWSQRYTRERAQKIISNYIAETGSDRLPLSVVVPSADIIPIDTIGMLTQEAVEMHNCVLSYVSRVVSGDCFLFKMIRPERATIEIVPRAMGGFALRQIKTERNSEPHPDTAAIAKEWVDSQECNAAYKETANPEGMIDETQP